MMESLLQNLDTLLVYFFGLAALAAGAMMIVLRHPMQVALALIAAMVSLGAVYGLIGVHFIAAFQVLIYVGAVMVFMVYAIMLLDVRDASYARRFSRFLLPGVLAAVVFVEALVYGFWGAHHAAAAVKGSFGLQQFAVAFLNEYWLHFELTSVLLVAAVVAAMAVIRGAKRHG